ncbi:hypothetical protein FHT28_006269 [Rhizobium sp. SG570]|nr:hypothetical protein [Rhizobium sp. SG570]
MQQNVSTFGKPGYFVRLNPVTGEIASTAQAATAVEAKAAAAFLPGPTLARMPDGSCC